jgi:hypothetical protein
MTLTAFITQNAALLYYTDRLLLMLWRLFASLRCVRPKEQHVFLGAVVLLVRPLAAAVRRRSQLICRIIVVASVGHLTISDLYALALGPIFQQTI